MVEWAGYHYLDESNDDILGRRGPMTSPAQILNRKQASRAVFEEASAHEHVSRFDSWHGYVYGRWPYAYIGISIAEKAWARRLRAVIAPLVGLLGVFRRPEQKKLSMADGYHGKVVPHDQATQLIQVKQDIEIRDLESVIPYPVARDIILQNPERIIALDCPCRNSRLDPCLPLDVCLIVGEPFASFVQSHHPNRSRWISSSEAKNILEAEHKRGHVHHAFFKDAMMGRFYAICNCCSCCCGAMYSHQQGSPMLASSGYVAVVEQELCLICESCAESCPFDAIALIDDLIHIDDNRCMGCGVCTDECDSEAIGLMRDENRPAPLNIRELIDQFDLTIAGK
jgi:Pyruvate/2-oxoacid:ferredoxin oxidoreductase delta subunit